MRQHSGDRAAMPAQQRMCTAFLDIARRVPALPETDDGASPVARPASTTRRSGHFFSAVSMRMP
jgi:hypothetical protein